MFDLSTGTGMRAARLYLGLTQAQVGRHFGLSQAGVHSLEARPTVKAHHQAAMRDLISIRLASPGFDRAAGKVALAHYQNLVAAAMALFNLTQPPTVTDQLEHNLPKKEI